MQQMKQVFVTCNVVILNLIRKSNTKMFVSLDSIQKLVKVIYFTFNYHAYLNINLF